MKLIKAIVFIALIFGCFSLSVRRVEKNNKKTRSKAKNDGSGSWKEGYNCPGFLVVTGNSAFDENQRKGKGKFFAEKLENPSTDYEKLGWVFDMSTQAPSDPLTKIMIKVGNTNNYYIPFRWLSSDFTYTNPIGYKYLDGWVTNDNKEVFHLRLLLPYASVSWYINDDEGRKLATLLNNKRTEHKGIVDSQKTAATTAANSYLSNKPLYDGASGDAAKLKQEKEKQLALVTSLTNEQKTKQTTFDTNQSTITNLESQLQSLRAAQNDLGSAISSISNQINTINQNLKTMDGGASASALASTYQNNLNKAKTDLATAVTALKNEAPIRGTEIDAAQNAIVTSLDKNAFTTNINKVYP